MSGWKNTGLPSELEHIISKALEKDLELRYQSVAELRADLQRLKRDADSGRLGSTRPYLKIQRLVGLKLKLPQGKRGLLFGSVAGLLVVFIATGLYSRRGKGRPGASELIARVQPTAVAGRFDEVYEQLQSISVDLSDPQMGKFGEAGCGHLVAQERAVRRDCNYYTRPVLSNQERYLI